MSKKLVSGHLWVVAGGANEAAAPGEKDKSSLPGIGEQEQH